MSNSNQFSFLTSFKVIAKKVNDICHAMDDKIDQFAEEVILMFVDYDDNIFSGKGDSEKDREDMKSSIKDLFKMFEQETKKKALSGYNLYQQDQAVRTEVIKNNPGIKGQELMTAISNQWKALDEDEKKEWNDKAKLLKPQTDEEKAAKKSKTSKSTKPKISCEYKDCKKSVKNPTEHTDGKIYCAEHYKKIVVEEAKTSRQSTPKCNHVDDKDLKCTKEAIDGKNCAKHIKKDSPAKNTSKSQKPSESKKKEEKEEKKPVTKIPSKVEKKEEKKPVTKTPSKVEEKEEKKPVTKTPASPKAGVFDYKSGPVFSIVEEPARWKASKIRIPEGAKDGSDLRVHWNKETNICYSIDSPYKLEGTYENGTWSTLKDLEENVKKYAKKCGFIVDEEEEDDEDLDEALDGSISDDE